MPAYVIRNGRVTIGASRLIWPIRIKTRVPAETATSAYTGTWFTPLWWKDMLDQDVTRC